MLGTFFWPMVCSFPTGAKSYSTILCHVQTPATVVAQPLCSAGTVFERTKKSNTVDLWLSCTRNTAGHQELRRPQQHRTHRWAIAPQHTEQFRIALSIFQASAQTIQRDRPQRPRARSAQLQLSTTNAPPRHTSFFYLQLQLQSLCLPQCFPQYLRPRK